MPSGTERKRQKSQEKKTKKRAVARRKHLETKTSARALAEHDHWIRFHTNPDDLTEEQRAHPGEDHTGHDHEVGSEEQRVQQLNQPLDVGTTRMKIDGFDGPSTPGGPAAEPTPMSIDELRESLGLH